MKIDRHHYRIAFAVGLIAVAVAGLRVVRARSEKEPVPHSGIPANDFANVSGSVPASVPTHKTIGPTLLVDAMTVRSQVVRPENTLSGQVEPYHTATVAAEVAERILRRPIERGDRVQEGAVLAILNADTAEAALAQARNAYAGAVASRRQAEADYRRAVVETDADRQQAHARVDQALADREKARALFAQATAGERKALAYTRRQEMHQAEDALTQAKTDERLARIELDRQTHLVREGAAPQQALDRAQAVYDAAVAHRQSAEQSVSLAKEGARQEDKDTASAQVAVAQAQVVSAGRQVEQARAGLRIANTRDTRLESLRRQMDGLRAQEGQAGDAVRQAQIALDRRIIKAPFTGRVLATFADVGDLVSPGTPIARLGEIRRVKVMFAVPEAARPTLLQGQQVTVTVDAIRGRRLAGQITALSFQADPKSRAFPIEVTVDNPDEALLPNMVARLALSVGGSVTRILIPSSAVSGSGGVAYVFVLEQERARRREVALGAPFGSEVEVLHGLKVGERIAATPQRLSDDAYIRVSAPGN